eukprot:CAMPEP_0171851522 /NCGR_PEP_ID=MMETSP0992-20121227/21075_1 /TAXON_ID=483369 /ORGANISM="non described non described, Strain CCMP2098" /LENGTH=199 /DNA_ID=CAMNT_0012471445 /DNA_START=58 /DNA_END=654 /DNA_ORIENTATION=+
MKCASMWSLGFAALVSFDAHWFGWHQHFWGVKVARGAVAPFCVTDLAVSAPCRVKRASDQAKRKKARVQASELAVIQAAEREERQRLNKAQARAAAALEWVDLCTEALATIRSGGYLRMAPCAPKRSFYDEELVLGERGEQWGASAGHVPEAGPGRAVLPPRGKPVVVFFRVVAAVVSAAAVVVAAASPNAPVVTGHLV